MYIVLYFSLFCDACMQGRPKPRASWATAQGIKFQGASIFVGLLWVYGTWAATTLDPLILSSPVQMKKGSIKRLDTYLIHNSGNLKYIWNARLFNLLSNIACQVITITVGEDKAFFSVAFWR